MLTSIHLNKQHPSEERKLHIAIFGIGALGCLLGARLSPYADVVVVGKWEAQLEALHRDPLRYIHADGLESHIRLRATNDLDNLAPIDVAIVATKSQKTESAARDIVQVLKPTGMVITLQNGLGNLEILAHYLPEERCTIGITTVGATLEYPGVVREAGLGTSVLGTKPEIDADVRALAGVFARAGLMVEVNANVKPLVWRKLAVNAVINPLTAILRVPNGMLLQSAWAQMVMRDVAREVVSLAAVQWIALTAQDLIAYIEQVAQETAPNRSSMLQDVTRGVPTEIEAICGYMLRLADLNGVPMPTVATLYRMVKTLEDFYPVRPPLG